MEGLTARLIEHGQAATRAVAAWGAAALAELREGPAVFIASGATAPAARLWAAAHESVGQPAWALTPYDLEQRSLPAGTRVVLMSVSGANHDIVRATQVAIGRGGPVVAVTSDPESPMARLARGDGARLLTLPTPDDEHLIANPWRIVGLTVAAASVYSGPGPWAERLAAAAAPVVWARRPSMIFSLGAGFAAPAAYDLAEKSVESGYAASLHTDERNFAHGALMVAANDPSRALVTLFATRRAAPYARRFAAALPPDMQRCVVAAEDDGIAGAVALVGAGIRLFHAALDGAAMAPTHHDVPSWGRTLHFLQVDDAV